MARKLDDLFGRGATEHNADQNQLEGSLWRPHHSIAAVAFVLLLYGFDALETVLYDHARAPNVGLLSQLTLLLFVYLAWVPVPRVVWGICSELGGSPRAVGLKLLVTGFALYVAHMVLLAIVLRVMYSPPGWGLSHLLHSTTELMIQQAGLWWLVFVGTAGLIVVLQRRKSQSDAGIKPPVFQVRHANKIVPVALDDILWIEAADNYVTLHTQGTQYLHRQSLNAIEKSVSPFGFIRSHRQAIVNKTFIRALSRDGEDGTYCIELTGGEKTPVSRRRLSRVKRELGDK